MTLQVAIVDDQALMRTGFQMILEAEPDLEVPWTATNGLEAVELCRTRPPDVVLMDVRMPELDGIEATRRVLGAGGDVPRVLILTTFDLDEYVFEAVRAGASGFLLKDTPPEELISAVRVVAGGEALLSPSVTRTLIEAFASQPAPSAAPTAPTDLTERELEVLVLMARGMSNSEIAAELILGETTVKTHVSRILMKLGLRDRVQAVVFAYEAGIVTPGV